jgi:uncharacterized protein YqeY
MSLKARLTEDMKVAMKGRDARRLGAVRLALAAIKQREVDERKDLSDADILGVLEKMLKQRRDSIAQYTAGNRRDLADQEQFEIDVLTAYLPQQASEGEVDAVIDEAIVATGAKGIAGMGQVMGVVKAKLAGRADMGQVSARVKARLA